MLRVEGAAGIGKSSLLRAARVEGEAAGQRWLLAAGSELERGFPFGVVLALFERLVADAGPKQLELLFDGAARLAMPVFGLSLSDQRLNTDELDNAARHGLYWLVANIAEREPLVLALDDAQWADLPSLRWLAYLARRIQDHRLLLIATIRTDAPDAPAAELDALSVDGDPPVRLPPLSVGAVDQLIRARLGDMSGTVAGACHQLAGGNPFYVGELVRAIEAGEVSAGQIAEQTDWAPARVSAAVRARLARLPPHAGTLVTALAVLGDGAQLQHLAALAELDMDAALTAVQTLTDAGLVADEATLGFVHPIVRSAVYASLPGVRRARMHGLAARLLIAQSAPVGVVALHLLDAHPAGDPEACDVLIRAAAQARERGAADTASALLQRALAEPPPAQRRVEVLLALAEVESQLHVPSAIERYEQAIPLLDERSARIRCMLPMARTRFRLGRVDEARDTLARILAALGPEDREFALEVEAEALSAELFAGAGSAVTLARLKALSARSTGATRAERTLLANLAMRLTMDVEPASEACRVARLALGDGRLTANDTSSHGLYQALNVLCYADALEECDRHFERAIADAAQRGAMFAYAHACSFRSRAAYRLGRLADAAALAQSALEMPEIRGSVFETMACGSLAEALIERGELDAADAALECIDAAPAPMAAMIALSARGARAQLRLAQRRFEEALREFAAAGEAQGARGAINPTMLAWRSGAASAAAHLGDGATAHALIEEELRLARAFGAPRAIGLALRVAGAIDGILAPGGASLDTLGEAVEVLAPSEARLEFAKALTELGSALRRAGQRSAAREQLRRGLDLALTCGALALADRARQEIEASGGRPRRERLSGIDSLTPSEHRVAQLAAGGMSNREIAQELFLSVKTVEMHVGRVFRKLDLSSRAQLRELMSGARV